MCMIMIGSLLMIVVPMTPILPICGTLRYMGSVVASKTEYIFQYNHPSPRVRVHRTQLKLRCRST